MVELMRLNVREHPELPWASATTAGCHESAAKTHRVGSATLDHGDISCRERPIRGALAIATLSSRPDSPAMTGIVPPANRGTRLAP
jgi:hypothetical protein